MATARARRRRDYTHDLEVREHRLIADEPEDAGGADQGPRPTELLAAALASCTAITIEMYADRKGWDVGEVAVDVEYTTPERDQSTRMIVTLHLPAGLSDDQVARLREIAGKCPVHRTLKGDVEIEDRVEAQG